MESKVRQSKKNDLVIRFALLALGMLFVSIGTTLTMKANLGQTSVSAFAKNIEYLSSIKSGTILAAVNYVCFFIQIILLKKEFKIIQVFQLVLTTIFGVMVNFFLYDLAITANMGSDTYILKLTILIAGLLLTTFGVGTMIKANLIFLPFEGFCNAVVYKVGKPFSTVRPIIDAVIVLISVVLIIVFNIPNTSVREGTIICTLLFGKLVGFFTKNIYKC